MSNKVIITVVSAIVCLVLILSSCFVCFFAIGVEKRVNVTLDELKRPEEILDADISSTITTPSGFVVTPNLTDDISTYGNVDVIVEKGRIVGYKTHEYAFSYDVSFSASIIDSIFINDENTISKYYSQGDMKPDILLLGDNVVSVSYDENKLPNSITVNDECYSSSRLDNGLISETFFGDTSDHKFAYNDDGAIVCETLNDGSVLEYSYINGEIQIANHDVIKMIGADSVVYTKNGVRYDYIFGYDFMGVRYITEIEKNGICVASYSYINSSVVSANINGEQIYYILDSDLNHLGMIRNQEKYYFVYDTVGNLYSIINEKGSAECFYEISAYGLANSDKSSGVGNTLLNANTVVDYETGAIISPSAIIFSHDGIKATLDDGAKSINYGDSLINGADSVYCDRGGLSFDQAVRGMILEESMYYLENQGYAVCSTVPIFDENDKHVDFADLYIMDSECAGTYIKNAFAGNRIYLLCGPGDNVEEYKNKVSRYADPGSLYFVDYYNSYKPVVGDLTFEGQFVYCNYLISYVVRNDGIISYTITENVSSNYLGYYNVYDYDNLNYAVFTEDTFSLSEWDYTVLIPGLNREQYDIVESYISDALQICSDAIYDDVRYFDQSYYDSYVNSMQGDTFDYFPELEEEAMIELSADGGVSIKAIPFSESTKVRKNFLKISASTTALVAIGGFISIAVPGSAPIVFAIVKAAVLNGAKRFFKSAIISVGMDLISGESFKTTVIDNLHKHLENAVNGYNKGLVSGVISGTLNYKDHIKITGDNLLTKNSRSAKLQIKLDELNDKYPHYLLEDSMAARMEYEKQVLTLTNISNRSVKEIITCKRTDSFIINCVLSGIDKVDSWVKDSQTKE